MSCEQKFALVTGASSGIGAEFSRLLAAKGYSLFITARREDRLNQLKEEIQNQHAIQVHVIPLDLSQPGAAQILFNKVQVTKKQISVLINNAGFGMYGPFLQSDEQKMNQMIQLNAVALMELSYLFAKPMADHGHGHILQVSSIGAFQPCPYFAAYAATKAFVLSLGEALYHELKPKGIVVCSLYPGLTRSEFFDAMGSEPKGFSRFLEMTPRQVAQQGLKALFKKRSGVTTGFLNRINAFFIKFTPRKWAAGIVGLFMRKTFKDV